MKNVNDLTIVCVGAGNLATHITLEMKRIGLHIAQIYSRTKASAQLLGDQLGVPYTNDLNALCEADIYLFALKDNALKEVLDRMPFRKGIRLHTSGSMPTTVFATYGAEPYGVIYPMQTFSKRKTVEWSEMPFFIEASDPETLQTIIGLVNRFGAQYHIADSEQRKLIHLAAVFACNFTNHMYAIAAEIAQQAGLPFEVLMPLIKESVRKIETLSPVEAQTGPAVRYDTNVIDKHIALLGSDSTYAALYRLISESIHKTHIQSAKP